MPTIGRGIRSKSGIMGGSAASKVEFVAIELSGDDIQGIKTIVASYSPTVLSLNAHTLTPFITGRLIVVQGRIQSTYQIDPLDIGLGTGQDNLRIIADANLDRYGLHYLWFEAGELESISGDYVTIILTPGYAADDAPGTPSEMIGRLSVSSYREVSGRQTKLEARP